eukprot:XP_006246178.1 PREDICTED: teneurin-2-like [Rattus norvegicus]
MCRMAVLPEGTGPELALHIALSLSLAPQYDFMERLDGKEKWSVVESPRERRSIQTLVQNEAVFVQYLDVGLWHLAFYNDGKDKEMVSFNTVVLDSVQDCPRNCHGNGECVSGLCHCFPGFLGADCAKGRCHRFPAEG